MDQLSEDLPAQKPAAKPTSTANKPVASSATSAEKKDSSVRRTLLIGGLFIFILLAFVFTLSASKGGENQLIQTLGIEGDIQAILAKVINVIFGIADIAAVIAIVIGVFVYLGALGDPKEVIRGKKILLFSVVSLFVVSFVWLITINFLNASTVAKTPTEDTGRSIITTPSPAECPAPCIVTFDVTGVPSTGYFFDWDFGDNSKGTGKVISHEYKNQGIHTATVKIIDSDSNELDVLREQVFINNALPKAKIIADPIVGRAPLRVNFDASTSSDDDGIINYEWDFGDPTYAGETNSNTATGDKATHVYEKDGTYSVTLTVYDTNNQKQSTTQTIEVGEAPDLPTAIISTTPPLDTSTDPYSIQGIPPFRVSFSGGKSRDSDGTVVEYVWDFGDGSSTEKAKTATHTYEDLGTYDVSLTVIDNDQKEDTQTVQIIVSEPPKIPTAVITTTPALNSKGILSGNVPLQVGVNGNKSNDQDGSVVEYYWDFGDGEPTTGQTASHTYTKAGEYTLSLMVVDNEDNESVPVTIPVIATAPGPQKPIARFTTDPEPASGNVPFSVDFDASASYDLDGSIISYEWDFGDGKSILGSSDISHIYASPGIYTVKLTVHDNEGLVGETQKPIAAYLPKPVAAISVNRDEGAVPLTIRFNASNSTGNITNYTWTFGDGAVDQGREVDHTYTASGTYTAKLTVKDTTEQIDSDSITISVE